MHHIHPTRVNGLRFSITLDSPLCTRCTTRLSLYHSSHVKKVALLGDNQTTNIVVPSTPSANLQLDNPVTSASSASLRVDPSPPAHLTLPGPATPPSRHHRDERLPIQKDATPQVQRPATPSNPNGCNAHCDDRTRAHPQHTPQWPRQA